MFQVKDFTSIVASMINVMRGTQRRLTDFNVGSVARSMLEAPAVEIDELYQQMAFGLREAIPVSIYRTFDFTRLPAVPASGMVRVTVTPSVNARVVMAGTIIEYASRGVKYAIQQDTVIAPTDSFVDVYVVADQAGIDGNIDAGTALTLSIGSISGLVSLVTQTAFISGAEAESDADRKLRFATFISTLNRGTVAAVRYGTLTARLFNSAGLVTESVRAVRVREPYLEDVANPPGWIEVYIHNGANGASQALVDRVHDVLHGYVADDGTVISGWKAAGVKTDIFAATTVAVDVDGTLELSTGYALDDVQPLVVAAVGEYLTALDIGQDALFAEVVAAIMGVDGVYNVTLTEPVADFAITPTQKAMPGTITLV